jgi:low temperature requirement protein LtrA
MSGAARRYLQRIWIGIAIQIVGRIRDGIWHAQNSEFGATAQQIEAHWILWIGIVVTLVAAGLAFLRLSPAERNVGYVTILAGGALYVPVAIWHFIEHANYNDPELAHYLLGVGQLAMIAGAAMALVLARRRPQLTG